METTRDSKITLFDRANSQQYTIFQHYLLSTVTNSHGWADWNSLHFVVWCLCMTVWNMVCLSHHRCYFRKAAPTTSLCSHPLFVLHKTSASVDVNRCNCFCKQEYSYTPLLHTPCMSDAIFSDCPSAASCHMATTCNGILAGRSSFYCHTTNIRLWHCRLT